MSWKTPTVALVPFLLLAPAAFADDTITLNIPVSVNSLSTEVGSVAAYCRIYDAAQGQMGVAWSNSGPVDGGGNFHGTLTAKFSMATGSSANAKTYQCVLSLMKPDGTGIAQMYPSGAAQCANIAACKPAPGAPLVGTVSGAISSSGPILKPLQRMP